MDDSGSGKGAAASRDEVEKAPEGQRAKDTTRCGD